MRCSAWLCLTTLLIPVAWGILLAAEASEPATFFRGLNLNGPSLEIDGRRWEGSDSKQYESRDNAFENQSVPLIPPTDETRALMIRSSRWSHDVAIRLREIPPGRYQVCLYIWEDNHSERFTLSVQGQVVANVESGSAGEWQRLGPFPIEISDDRSIVVYAQGGAANISGIEVWSGWGRVPDVGETHVVTLPTISPEAADHFRNTVAPLLATHCLECHSAADPRGGLDLSSWRTAMAGGESGHAIVPGQPDDSLVWTYVDLGEMPQNRPSLTAEERQVLREWIAAGAPWADERINPFLRSTDRRAGYDWWSLQPVIKPAVPVVSADVWPTGLPKTASGLVHPIDAFLGERLHQAGLQAAPLVDRRTLIRRLTYDLIGLPPTPEEVEAFCLSRDPEAERELIERLLASPHYGERWARHWLDVIRFGESQGYERNRIRENAWRYRDWVIEAFNRNLPYDEFIRQQIAGDVLYPDDLSALIATGYHVIGTWDQVGDLEGSSEMQKANRQDHLEDLTGTLGQAFLGLTINCARCHDHKFDPLTQEDYYRITALLSGIRQREHERSDIPLPARSDRLAERDFDGTAHVSYFEQPATTFRLARGDYRQPREVIVPAGIAALEAAGLPSDLGLSANSPDGERRLRLAEWLTDPRNPLTARVFVNRVWHHHFGRGLVETPSDFGFAGGQPTHPELLDYLAATFIESGWDIQELHRLIVTSHAYRQHSRVINPLAEQVDADNDLLWRANRRQLEGEAVRDAALYISGMLQRDLGGPSFRDVHVHLGRNHEFTTPTNEFSPETCRRSIYRLWARSGNHPLMDCLDCPDPTVAAPRRNRTITPLQALSLLNNGFMDTVARRFAERVQSETGDDLSLQVQRAYAWALSREPSPRELELTLGFAREHGFDQFCLTLLNTNEFLFVD